MPAVEEKSEAAAPATPSKGKKEKEGEEGDGAAVHVADARIAWFEERVCNALKIKSDKWKKMLTLPENIEALMRFVETHPLSECGTLLFYLNIKDELIPTTTFPSSLKKKSIYFIRSVLYSRSSLSKDSVAERLDPVTMENELVMGELNPNPLEFLGVLLEEVYLPLLTNPKNLETWPEVVADDVLRHFHSLNGAVYVISGKSKGKTMLPLPHGARISPAPTDKTILHTLESAVIDWTHQIKEVIGSSSAAPLEEGLNPGPMVEIDFWAAKAANLKSIHMQLTDERIQKISKVLEASKSTYYPAFRMIFDEVVFALDEASDINTYLRALRPVVERLNSSNDFSELTQVFPILMHTLVLIWRHSKYYNTPTRLTVVLQEICNDIVEQARNFVQPGELFSSEPEEAAERLRLVLRVADAFHHSYYEAKAETAESDRPWNFDAKLVFARLDSFVDRVRMILELFDTIIEFNRLEKIEIGGTKGKILSSQVAQIFTEFTSALAGFSKLKYDVLDISLKAFDDDLGKFHEKITDLDRRIGTILSQSFDDCPGMSSCFRLLESFAGLLSRPTIQHDFEKKYFALLQMYTADLDDVHTVFLQYKDNPPIHYNMAPVTGAVAWIHELKDRIVKTMDKLKSLNHSAMNSEEANIVKNKYHDILSTLESYERSIYTVWSDTIIDESEANLNKPLLVRSDGLLQVNFDPKVVALLREVRYFEALSVQPPQTAAVIYSKADVFRKYIFSLDHIAGMYNGTRTGVLDVERPLIERRIETIDAQVERALSSVNWKSKDIEESIQAITASVGELSSILQIMKNNVTQIQKIMKAWSASPLVERKDGKKLLNLEEKEAKLVIIYDSIKRDGQSIHALIANTRTILEVDEDAETWLRYREYVDGLVKEGFWSVIKTSTEYLVMNMDPTRMGDLGPLMEAKLELDNEALMFTPSMDEDSSDSLAYIINDLLEDIYEVAALMGRIAPPKDDGKAAFTSAAQGWDGTASGHPTDPNEGMDDDGTDADQDEERARELEKIDMENLTYLGDMRRDETLGRLRREILDRVQDIMGECLNYKDSYDQFTYLWTENRQDYMKQFLQIDHTNEDGSIEAKEDQPIQLEKFESEIRKFEQIHKTIMAIEPEVIFSSWFRIDARPLKQSLNVVVKKWSYTLTKHLSDDAVTTLNELNRFVRHNKKGLQSKIEEGDYEGLVSAMGLLHAIKHRTGSIDHMFEPLRKTINLLRQFNVEMPEEIHKLLNDLPEEWSEVKKLSVSIKDHVAPLQAKEVDVLQQKCNRFETRNHNFREEFRRKAPFRFDIGPDRAYELIDAVHIDVLAMENEANALRTSCELFELNVPTYKQLGDCRRDIGMLKTVWDVVALVTFMFEEWRTTLWTEIDTESMEGRCRDLSKDTRKMDKEIKGWDVYSGLDQMVKDMLTSLRAVGELRSNAIRDRHWKQLMKTTGVTFVLTQDMKFQDLLSLQLHRFEDEVKVIVDRATKELSMEKVLNDLSKTWNVMEFTYEMHEATHTPLLRSSEELIETLEENQVMLQNMMTSKYVAHFESQITKWQNVLSTVDSVITLWLEVQQTWSHLENIFMGSEDIRAQLPEDSKRFDGIDASYKELMGEASKTPNCVDACTKEGLYEKLERLQGQLALCEKSLAEYLETKRLAFPRFYFVSGSDLLDILAKGNQPQEVAIHLPKLFDSISRLEFERKEGGEVTKTAIGMYSKEDEYVPFGINCECTGPVEVWLNRLVDTMRKTLKTLLGEAVSSYEEKPREQWIFDHPAQITLAGTGIWWTTEVNVAFGRLEEGYENSLKDYYKKQINQLTALISLIQGELSRGDRQMIMTVCTLDVHARDIVAKLIAEKAENAGCFSWQSQLRLRWDDVDQNDCFINICDATFRYNYEYLGNTPRLVVTALTDRCYITLTQSLHLIMGGAPAGPAGTGKTETVKDLGKALAIMVYVFNCSEQMDYKSVGDIFKGLAQSGTWGCFDEFNRIAVEVLSVIATQVKSIQDALRAKKKRFNFQGEDISLTPTVGAFITMNPGYAGRTELPENIKALFRPCSMCVPNLELICEIYLMAQGFIEAASLARKFTTLYKLNRELLSKQDHYDWALRAIKSVLVVAGSLKRSDPHVPEEHVLMRALRDFNVPKIVTDDLPVFHGLINDLFPKVDVPRKRQEKLEDEIRKATIENGLQAEDVFVLKVVQLEELLAVRHCVFIIGNGGTGKSQIWKMLARTYNNSGRKCVVQDLNPKAVSTDDLFGCINPSTREWKDGLFSCIMREQASAPGTDPKWMILDGDIDPNWIESLNTVMDDNKMLTLASNERIPVKEHMRLIFEIGDLKYATPATVSRAGILYLNSTDVGWNPFVQSWLDKREDAAEKSSLSVLFERYVNPCLDAARSGRFKMANVEEFSMVVALCNILEGLLTQQNTPKGCDKEWFEIYFVFAAVWAFGGCVFQDQLVDYRVEFSKWWNSEFKIVKFPATGTVFDYFVESETKRFLPWSERVPTYEHDSEMPLSAVLVHTPETTRIRYFLDVLADNGKPVLLVGNAGCGKTVLMQDKLYSYGEDRLIVNVPFNFFTTAWSVQSILEKPLEKKAGRNYGPPGTKKLIYFLDDLNMPEVDKYGTASPHTILRQYLDYKHWYDRSKLTLKEIHNCQYVACMNPTAGSFTVSGRLSRHFACFAVNFPGVESLQSIYFQILAAHLKIFPNSIQKLSDKLVAASLLMHKKVASSFLPTAIKFHYIFNLRDLSNIYQGILFSNKDTLNEPMDLVRLFLHEATRTYGDKMIDASDRAGLLKIQEEIVKKTFDDMDQAAVKAEPIIFTHFATGIGEPKYGQIKEWTGLKKLLDEAQMQYEEVNAAMNLVLFEDAMSHVCRINRILESPRGNALLVGVGGSGKQSLARLAAFISQMEVFQITLRKGYSISDLRTDLAGLYTKTGLKKIQIMFLLTDSQIADEKFLVLINDMLASGNIPGLYPDEEVEGIINAMRNEAKAQGLVDTREVCWDLFIRFVRKNLKVVLCFSPVGNTLRSRCRKFPAIVNCTMIDWFQEWPEEALTSVATRFISSCDLVSDALKGPVTKFMSFAHQSVNEVSRKYLLNEKRHNYTTPKSFLALISIYKEMLEKKAKELTKSMDRLENGLTKLQSTASQVDDLKAKLAFQEVDLKAKNDEAMRLIERVGIDTEKANKEKAIAAEEERKVDVITKEVGEKQASCSKDLRAAEPALAAAAAALNSLNKANLTELKSFGSPSEEVKNVAAAVMVLLSPPGKIAKDRSWKASKNMMAKVDAFLESLVTFNKENIDASNLEALQPYLSDPNFNEQFMKSKSIAAAGLCSWVVNIVGYYNVYCDVEPKRKALEAANAELQTSQSRLREIQAKISDLDRNLADLKAKFEKATADKLKCEEEARSTQETIVLANRLVNGLASEKVRWSEAVGKFKEQEKTLAGDVLLSAAFVSYVGCFSKRYREELLQESWLAYLKKEDNPYKVPLSEGVDPLDILTSSAEIAKWNNEGLPTDRVSLENATMVTSCKRWPLIIDPQLQGVTWIKNKEGPELRIVRLGQRGYLDAIEKAVSTGETVLIEDIAESIDAVLNPLLGRETIKKGKYIKLGDKEVEYDPRFKLIIQTRRANPHYPPEIQAQTTLINFTVTLAGLEDQLLADVVNTERPDLERTKAELTKQQNEFKIKLTELEDALLSRLSAAQGNFLGDTALVENLETTKSTATDIEQKVEEAKKTEKKINETRELYRPVAARSSLLYFLLNDLWQIHPMYQYSLNAYKVVFQNAISRAEASEDIKERVLLLIDSITHMVFIYTTRGLFEKDKLIFLAQMTFQILIAADDMELIELDFLLRGPRVVNVNSPFDWLSHASWGMIKALSNLETFRTLSSDIEGSSKQWKKYCENECPENEKLPQEWKNKSPMQKLCILRCLRPDRMTYAVRNFIGAKMGQKYMDSSRVPLPRSFEESAPATPIFFILSPGVDPVKEVEALGRQMGVTEDNKNFHNVSLGQGQEIIAEQRLDTAYKEGGWVMLENIHLVAKWLPILEKKLEALSVGSHHDFRVFLSAEPAGDPAYHIIPISVLQSSIKITNEPPTGMQANIHRALDNFSQETLERCSKDAEFKAILFALCYFHAVVLERRKFGTQGWNKPYPFSTGDLQISSDVLYNYLETFPKVPWTDLRYMFSEIMYGGHISDDWDRRLCSAYLDVYLREEMMEGNFELAPGFTLPPTSDYKEYHRYIDESLPAESPYLYGLHPNAEIGVLTKMADKLFKTILEMQPRDTAGGSASSKEEKVAALIEDIMGTLPESFNVAELSSKVEERTPYISVALQECDRMSMLTSEIRRSLRELQLGLKGDLTITENMELLMNALFLNEIPASWEKLAFPSLQALAAWYADLLLRIKELENWVSEFQLPSVVWLAGLFNPQSFLTAIMQTTARKSEWPLDRMVLTVEVTKKAKEEYSGAPREGAYVHGLFMEGARWDTNTGMIQESLLKDLTPTMPVIYIKAIPVDKKETKGVYECPVYRTRQRGPTFIWTFNLKTKERPQKWILGGVCLLCSAE
ncbi:dynein heavy chain and region D6 of dynein motor-domain-containing protein [Blyttiomyces helicus]|uniref:Dynein heavy chain, cytoplasmic n=1 Tax=Blyttiomyces helicus TaxID=388810 RepID=A0A4P9WQC9_9FUNG|nr:dynein heavy chain and region D6 of dynein motor-domain-containing protein [Blyttiomyces helicus]|eukprot:RKO94585.1 dynein heavy chain and region D6 of dynein motor-domain-containing protein [Blyttiomyces helicus]